jgi:hypothetical protein
VLALDELWFAFVVKGFLDKQYELFISAGGVELRASGRLVVCKVFSRHRFQGCREHQPATLRPQVLARISAEVPELHDMFLRYKQLKKLVKSLPKGASVRWPCKPPQRYSNSKQQQQ